MRCTVRPAKSLGSRKSRVTLPSCAQRPRGCAAKRTSLPTRSRFGRQRRSLPTRPKRGQLKRRREAKVIADAAKEAAAREKTIADEAKARAVQAKVIADEAKALAIEAKIIADEADRKSTRLN